MNPQDTKIIELENKIEQLSKKVEEFDIQKNTQSLERFLGKIMKVGTVTLNALGEAHYEYSGLSKNNIVVVSNQGSSDYNVAGFIQTSTLNPSINEIYFSGGQVNDVVNFVVFFLSDKTKY